MLLLKQGFINISQSGNCKQSTTVFNADTIKLDNAFKMRRVLRMFPFELQKYYKSQTFRSPWLLNSVMHLKEDKL